MLTPASQALQWALHWGWPLGLIPDFPQRRFDVDFLLASFNSCVPRSHSQAATENLHLSQDLLGGHDQLAEALER